MNTIPNRELRKIAKRKDIKNYSKMNKELLLKKIIQFSGSSSNKFIQRNITDNLYKFLINKEIPKVPYRYTFEQILGMGSFGIVAKSVDNITKQTVAIKIQRNVNVNNTKLSINEIEKLIAISNICDNLVCILDYGLHHDNIFIVMNYVNGIELSKLEEFRNNKFLLPKNLKLLTSIFKQLINAVHLLHSNNIVHMDIKPDNIILTSDNIVHLVDLGLACNDMLCPPYGTPNFIPPSLAHNKNSTFYQRKLADYWSIGMTFLYTIGWGNLAKKYISVNPKQGSELIANSGWNAIKQEMIKRGDDFLIKVVDLIDYDESQRERKFQELVRLLPNNYSKDNYIDIDFKGIPENNNDIIMEDISNKSDMSF